VGIGTLAPKSKNFAPLRRETRVPMEVGVDICGHVRMPGTETTFTENVSSRGARVLSARRWNINDQLVITMRTGSFQSVARVAYCQPVPQAGYAVGLEFLEPRGEWVVSDGAAAN
jgi:hypothetical protein